MKKFVLFFKFHWALSTVPSWKQVSIGLCNDCQYKLDKQLPVLIMTQFNHIFISMHENMLAEIFNHLKLIYNIFKQLAMHNETDRCGLNWIFVTSYNLVTQSISHCKLFWAWGKIYSNHDSIPKSLPLKFILYPIPVAIQVGFQHLTAAHCWMGRFLNR